MADIVFSDQQFNDELEKVPSIPDTKSGVEQLNYKVAQTEAELKALQLKNENYSQNIVQRKKFAKAIFILVCIWLFIVVGVVIACGLEKLKLSDTILCLLLGTTTANIFSCLFFVVKYLFYIEGEKAVNASGAFIEKAAKSKKNKF